MTALLLALLLAAPPAQEEFAHESAELMGTRFQIIALAQTPEQRAAMKQALELVAELHELWSPWVEGSDIARVNAAAGKKPVPVDQRTIDLLVRSIADCRRTGRAFDPTFFALSPLYPLKDDTFTPPSQAQIDALLPDVDCRRIEVDTKKKTVRLARPGMRLHLGANAKGTALDVAARHLIAAGITRFVVDGGGDIVVQGNGPSGGPWRVGIQDPRKPRGALIGNVPATAGAVATSGDYERFKIIDGRRYHHIVDPRDGHPARGCRSVTVTVPAGPHAGELADSLATAMCVLGHRDGFPILAEVHGATAALVDVDGGVHVTEGFPGWIEGGPSRPAP